MHLFTGAGRVGRLNYLGLYVLIVATMIVTMFLSIRTDEVTGETTANPLFLLVALVGIWMANANVVRRLHDTGHSGWLALLGLVPIISIGLGFYLLFTAGDPIANRYGPVPGQPDQLPPHLHQERVQGIREEAARAYAGQQSSSAGVWSAE